MGEWLSTVEFAELVGIRRQVAHRALRRRHWRKNPLEVRKVNGRRGGNAGEQYQVNSTFLPLDSVQRQIITDITVEGGSAVAGISTGRRPEPAQGECTTSLSLTKQVTSKCAKRPLNLTRGHLQEEFASPGDPTPRGAG